MATVRTGWINPVYFPLDKLNNPVAENYGHGLTRVDLFSASPCFLNGGNVDLLHRHHRLKSTSGFITTRSQRIG